MSKVATVIVCLIIGIIGGFGAGYAVYQPKIEGYEIQVSSLTSEVGKLSQAMLDKETQISALEAGKLALQSDVTKLNLTVSSQQAQILTLASEKSGLQSQVIQLNQTISSKQTQLANLESEKSRLQNRLDKILAVNVTQYYEWTYQGKAWKWNLPIPLSLYDEYLERPRPALGAAYVDMARDTKDDNYINSIIQQINNASIKEGFTEVAKISFTIAFIQSLPYTVDTETTPYNEYPRYPIETLFDRGGDCEDTSILAAALLDKMGYDVALLLLRNARHMAIGISMAGNYGSYYEYGGKKYFYLETTGDGWQMGQIPSSITDRSAYIYPLKG